MNVTSYGNSHWKHMGRVSEPRSWRQGTCPTCRKADTRLVRVDRLGPSIYLCPPCRAEEER